MIAGQREFSHFEGSRPGDKTSGEIKLSKKEKSLKERLSHALEENFKDDRAAVALHLEASHFLKKLSDFSPADINNELTDFAREVSFLADELRQKFENLKK